MMGIHCIFFFKEKKQKCWKWFKTLKGALFNCLFQIGKCVCRQDTMLTVAMRLSNVDAHTKPPSRHLEESSGSLQLLPFAASFITYSSGIVLIGITVPHLF